MQNETYSFKDGVLTLIDPELGLSLQKPFKPLMIPAKRVDGKKMTEGHLLRMVLHEGAIEEIFVEKEGQRHGHYLSFYSTGKVKMEGYYLHGKLHGPSIFYNEEGIVLAKNWFVSGKRQGKSYWYYHSGTLYSLQSFLDGVWHGKQEYYYPDGQLKTLMQYVQGKLEGDVYLYKEDGTVERELHFPLVPSNCLV